MNISVAYPSLYLKSDDLNHGVLATTILRVELKTLASEQKPILYIANEKKGIVLNKTNAKVIAARYGDDTDQWAGKPIEVFSEPVYFQGRTVPGIRVRIPTPPSVAAALPTRVGKHTMADLQELSAQLPRLEAAKVWERVKIQRPENFTALTPAEIDILGAELAHMVDEYARNIPF